MITSEIDLYEKKDGVNASFSRPNMVRTKGDGGAARTVASKVKLLNKDLLDFEYLMQAPRKALGGGGSSGAASRAIASSAGGGGVAGADVSSTIEVLNLAFPLQLI